jgi:retron-type reverse transcriptase
MKIKKKTSPYSEISKLKNLISAWSVVHSNGIKSKSEETRHDIEIFKQNEYRNLVNISRRLQKKTFKFKPAKGIHAKKRGKKPRPLVIAGVETRIVQRSILNVLQSKKEINKILKLP